MNKTSVERLAYSNIVSSIEYRVKKYRSQKTEFRSQNEKTEMSLRRSETTEAISIRLPWLLLAMIFNNLWLFSRYTRYVIYGFIISYLSFLISLLYNYTRYSILFFSRYSILFLTDLFFI